MRNSFYVALDKQLGSYSHLNQISHNSANISTNGYKEEHNVFKSLTLQNDISFPNNTRHKFIKNHVGPIEKTFRELDLAILTPNQYFGVLTNVGLRYTRNGSFVKNNEGILVDRNGFPVVSADGSEIFIDGEDVIINGNGEVISDIGKIGEIGVFTANEIEIKDGFSLIAFPEEPETAAEGDFTIKQGFLERSNVSAMDQIQGSQDAGHYMKESIFLINNSISNLDNIIKNILSIHG